MRRLRSTLILLAVLIGLGAYISFKKWNEPSLIEIRASRPKVLAVTPAAVEHVTVRSASGETTIITKVDETWRITSPVAAEADEVAISGITRDLGNLEILRVLDEKPSDLKQYGLDPPRVEVIVKVSGDPDPKHLLIGDKIPGGENLYVKLAAESRVSLVAASFDDTFNKNTWDLRDRSVLKVDRLQIDSLEIVGPVQTVALTRHDLEWHLTRPLQTEADLGVVSEMIAKVTSAQMQSIVAPVAEDLARYGLAKPVYTVTLGAGSPRVTLQVGARADESTTYARDVSRPIVFTIETSLADELTKPLAEYRRKDVFAFASYDANRIEVTRSGETRIYEKTTETGNDVPQWREASPNAREVGAEPMDAALSRLSLLRAVAFVDSAKIKTALQSPDIAVLVRYKDGRNEERVRITSIENAPYAAREAWVDAARLDATAYARLIEALDALEK